MGKPEVLTLARIDQSDLPKYCKQNLGYRKVDVRPQIRRHDRWRVFQQLNASPVACASYQQRRGCA